MLYQQDYINKPLLLYGRRDRTDTDRYYSDEYADKIMKRANDPNAFVPIEIKLAK